MIHRHIKISPSDRMSGNAVITHILDKQCYGRMMLISYTKNTEMLQYQATYQCAHCGGIIITYTNKSGL